MPTFLEYLEAFNRKERFFVVAAATGTSHPGKAAFKLSPEFRAALGRQLGIDVPESALGFMDYHLDWIHAAAVLTKRGTGWPDGPILQSPVPNDPTRVATGSQEDIDLVVAFESDGRTVVVLLEAKAESGWTNSQMNSKAPRLKAIFGEDGQAVPGVVPVLCLWSPKDTKGLTYAGWPSWCYPATQHHWLELKVAAGRMQVFGASQDGGFSRTRTHWNVKATPSLVEESASAPD